MQRAQFEVGLDRGSRSGNSSIELVEIWTMDYIHESIVSEVWNSTRIPGESRIEAKPINDLSHMRSLIPELLASDIQKDFGIF
jgi:hypothetical protein